MAPLDPLGLGGASFYELWSDGPQSTDLLSQEMSVFLEFDGRPLGSVCYYYGPILEGVTMTRLFSFQGGPPQSLDRTQYWGTIKAGTHSHHAFSLACLSMRAGGQFCKRKKFDFSTQSISVKQLRGPFKAPATFLALTSQQGRLLGQSRLAAGTRV